MSLSWAPEPVILRTRLLVQPTDPQISPFLVELDLYAELLSRCLRGRRRAIRQLGGRLLAKSDDEIPLLDEQTMVFTLLEAWQIDTAVKPWT